MDFYRSILSPDCRLNPLFTRTTNRVTTMRYKTMRSEKVVFFRYIGKVRCHPDQKIRGAVTNTGVQPHKNQLNDQKCHLRQIRPSSPADWKNPIRSAREERDKQPVTTGSSTELSRKKYALKNYTRMIKFRFSASSSCNNSSRSSAQ